MTVFESVFSIFLTAHLLGDFVFQSEQDIEQKERPAILLKHGMIHAVLILLLAGHWTVWLPALVIASTHLAIDLGKRRLADGGWKAFLADQALHVFVIAVVASQSLQTGIADSSIWARWFDDAYFELIAVAGGLIATVTAGAYFVGMAVESFLAQIRAGRSDAPDEPRSSMAAIEHEASTRLRGLRDGGKTIGQLERALIFVFVLIDQFTAIGFLIAAKSIFRFGELRDRSNRMEAEYIIIGTLVSFLWAIVAALLTRMLAGF